MKKPRKKEICNREQKTLPIHPSFLFRSIKNLDFIFHRFHQLEQGFLLFFGQHIPAIYQFFLLRGQ